MHEEPLAEWEWELLAASPDSSPYKLYVSQFEADQKAYQVELERAMRFSSTREEELIKELESVCTELERMEALAKAQAKFIAKEL